MESSISVERAAPAMSLKSIARSLIPAKLRGALRTQERLIRHPREIRKLALGGASEHEVFTAVVSSPAVYTLQKEHEILALLDICRSINARTVCEIGTQKGGTLILMMQLIPSLEHLVSLDIHMPLSRQFGLQRAKQPPQRLDFIVGDSKLDGTLSELRQVLGSHPLDVLFIDGDHSFDGVKHDFEMYSPLVRAGGIIAFHDIVPDYAHSRGVVTGRRTGEVPEFWKSIRDQYRYLELIEDPSQDGFGIGVLYV